MKTVTQMLRQAVGAENVADILATFTTALNRLETLVANNGAKIDAAQAIIDERRGQIEGWAEESRTAMAAADRIRDLIGE